MTISSPTGTTVPSANISGYKLRNIPQFTPQQMQLFQSLLGGVQGGARGGLDFLSQLAGGNEDIFTQAEQPAYSAFNKALGQIGSRFAGLGALDSSAFQNAASGAAGELGENLAANRLNLQQNAIDRLLNLSQGLLNQRPYDTFLERKQKSPGIGSILASILPSFLGAF